MLLVSFDIFDTSLIRLCGEPDGIFRLVAETLFPNDEETRSTYIATRNDIEKWMWTKKLHYSIYDLYADDVWHKFLPLVQMDLAETEMRVEENQLFANPNIRDIITKFRTAGAQIAFISDMYLPSSFLQKVLQREGCWKDGDLLYVSCEENARKSSGELYAKIKNELHPQKWVHYGDNIKSDFSIAKKNGIKANLVDTSFVGIEKSLSDKTLAGVIRAIRFQMGDNSLTRLSVHFVATIYVPYVLWILRKAKEYKHNRLYFLSRDSYILMKIAETLPHEGLEIRYLFASRKSLSNIEEKENTLLYFEQEGLFENVASAIVDVGWLGTTRKMINEILDQRNAKRIHFYYFSVWDNAIDKSCGNYDRFISHPSLNSGSCSFIEDFCSLCPYPTTIGYYYENGIWHPKFPEGEQKDNSSIIESNITACLKFAEFVTNMSIPLDQIVSIVSSQIDRLYSFKEYIDFSPLDGLEGCADRPMAKHLSFKEIFHIAKGGMVTLNDRMSLEMTVGLTWMRIIMRVHNFIYQHW